MMTIRLLPILLLFFVPAVYSQTVISGPVVPEEFPKKEIVKTDTTGLIFAVLDDKPDFEGGEKALFQWMAENTHYPSEASDLGITGRVVIGFSVKQDGTVYNAYVHKRVCPSLDQEALRVVNSFPKEILKPTYKVDPEKPITYFMPFNFKVEEVEDPLPFDSVEIEPEFPGGLKAMYEWIGEHLVFPPNCVDIVKEGTVNVTFIIEKDGTISNVESDSKTWTILKTEVLKVIEAMPKWRPGMNNGKPVRVEHAIPIKWKTVD